MNIQLGLNRSVSLRQAHGKAVQGLERKKPAEEAQTFSTLPPLTTQQLTRELQCVVLQFPTAVVVEDTQASLRAIETVRAGEGGMSLKTFFNLCRANPRVRAMVAPLLGYGDESNPNVVHAISVLMNELVRAPIEDACDETPVPDREIHEDLFGRSP